jgi:hypothetical protein
MAFQRIVASATGVTPLTPELINFIKSVEIKGEIDFGSAKHWPRGKSTIQFSINATPKPSQPLFTSRKYVAPITWAASVNVSNPMTIVDFSGLTSPSTGRLSSHPVGIDSLSISYNYDGSYDGNPLIAATIWFIELHPLRQYMQYQLVNGKKRYFGYEYVSPLLNLDYVTGIGINVRSGVSSLSNKYFVGNSLGFVSSLDLNNDYLFRDSLGRIPVQVPVRPAAVQRSPIDALRNQGIVIPHEYDSWLEQARELQKRMWEEQNKEYDDNDYFTPSELEVLNIPIWNQNHRVASPPLQKFQNGRISSIELKYG